METTNTLQPTELPEPDADPGLLTLEAIYEEKIFEAQSLRSPQWMRDSLRFSYLDTAPGSETTVVYIYDTQTGTRTPIVEAAKLTLPKEEQNANSATAEDDSDDEDAGNAKPDVYSIPGYLWSPDETRLLFAHRPRPHSGGDPALYVYTLASHTLKRVTQTAGTYRNAKWSPDSKMLGYVRDNDLYLLDLASGHETRLTESPSPTTYNGRYGWVYDEELDLADGWDFAPDGKTIAFAQTDESPVPQINLPNYDELHLKPVETRYPKAGDPNPIVRIGLISLERSEKGIEEKRTDATPDSQVKPQPFTTLWVDLGPDTDVYINRMQWTPWGELWLQRIPRLQNRLDVLRVEPSTGKTTSLLTETDAAWVDSQGDITFVKGRNEFLWLSERDGFKHVYLYDRNGKLERQLTRGNWEVASLSGVDDAHRILYFMAKRPTPAESQLYSVLLDSPEEPVALTDTPGSHSCLFAPDARHYLDTHSSRTIAPHVKLYMASGQHIASVHANPMPKLDGKRLGTWEYTTFKTSDGVTLNAALLRPFDFDPKKKYPVLMYTYGGPDSQVIVNRWGNGGGLEQFLAQKGFVFVLVDGRGGGGRGRDFKKVTYQNLGHWEVHDQIEGAKWLGSLPYVDAARIGIWGWSYGGYMASNCILRGADVFKAAIAVAPVTDWALYDSIYTERYMRRPQDNPKGYHDSSPLLYADRLKGRFLLVHGTADDNVHVQNSMRLAAEFQKRNKPFRVMIYPGKHHGLEGVSSHLFAMLTDFIAQNL